MKPYNTDQTKKEEVREMFDRIAPRYDLLNHTLSMNIDRIWRRHVVREVRRSAPRRILDVATGTGDLAIEMAAGSTACRCWPSISRSRCSPWRGARSRRADSTDVSSSTEATPST